MEDLLRFCLIGAGRAGMVHARNIVHNVSNAELVAIVDMNENQLKERGEELGINYLYADIDDALEHDTFDAVVIGSPTFTHHFYTVKCADAGKHVFCEKPMAVSASEAREMIDTAEKNNIKLQIAFMRRFDSLFQNAKSVLESGELGDPVIIKSLARGPGLPAPWYYDISKSNGLLAEICSHDFDSCRWFSGSEYRRVHAEAVNRKTPEIRKKYPDFYDNVVCTFRMKNDVIGTIDSTCPADYGFDVRGEIVLTKGLIVIGEVQGEAILTCDTKGAIGTRAFKSWRTRFKESYINEIRSFIDVVLKDGTPLVTGYDGLASVEAVVAANQSIKTGVPVEL
jgi:myo-inositol 2-dehydrogenase/D-chiro-inositol 1-dehydrogenase/scyllo-inositol 2-dehydrogenase (NAD+)